MYTSNILVERIRLMVKNKQTTIKELLSFCELNENTLNQMSDKKGLSSFSLAKIADYLECSVDYLLGRTEEPSLKSETNLSVAGDINAPVVNNSGKMVDSANTPEPTLDEMQQELLNQFGKLGIKDKITFLHQIIQRAEEIK